MALKTSVLLLMLLSMALPVCSIFQHSSMLGMAKILLENYCIPKILVAMQEAIQRAIKSQDILQISDRKTLVAVLTVGVQGALNDPWLSVSYEPNFTPLPPQGLSLLPMEQRLRLLRNSSKLDSLEDGVGYSQIDRIVDEETLLKIRPPLRVSIWDDAAQTASLVLHLRYSTAGGLSGEPPIISYFSDTSPYFVYIDRVYDR